MYYSYDPQEGIEFHSTIKEAKLRAEKALEAAIYYAEDSDYSWFENEDEISYGKVNGRVTVKDTKLKEGDELKKENPDWDFIRSVELNSV